MSSAELHVRCLFFERERLPFFSLIHAGSVSRHNGGLRFWETETELLKAYKGAQIRGSKRPRIAVVCIHEPKQEESSLYRQGVYATLQRVRHLNDLFSLHQR
jgi:hypothetical protein